MSDIISLGLWIKQRRKALDLTQDALAALIGCSLALIQKIEADARRPSREIAALLADTLELAADERVLFIQVARAELSADRLAPPAQSVARGAFVPAQAISSAADTPGQRRTTRLTNLPAPPTPLIGRETELAQIADRLEQRDCRLLTLVGPGGVGKTRLALQAAINLSASFPDGAYFVPLAALSSAALLVPAIAGALGCTFHGSTDPQAQLITHLREQEILLVLDNFEQLLAGANILVDLIQAAPGVKLLATSREPLHLRVEWLLDIPGLLVRARADASGVEQPSAVRLFVQTANRMQADFTLSPATIPSVVRICQFVAGMPLAIELAAAWVRSRSCSEIARELEQSLESLATMMHDVPARHRSMRAVFDHSWRLLSDAEQGVLRQLSVFRGGMQADAAARVAGATPFLMAALVDKSLLRHDGTGRYELHELVRQYAGEQLAEAGEAESTRDTHAADFLNLADASNPGLDGPERATWLRRLEQEHDNLRAALAWCQAAGRIELGLRVVIALRLFWDEHGHLQEGGIWLEAALAPSSVDVPGSLRAAALNSAAIVSSALGEYTRAQELAEQSLALFRADEIPEGIAWALDRLGDLAMMHDNTARASVLAEESLALHQELCDRWWIANDLAKLGQIAHRQGDNARAAVLFDDSLTLFRELEDKAGIATQLCLIGEMLHAQGDDLRAASLLEESLAIFRELENKGEIPWALGHLARVVHTQGDDRRATGLFQEGLELAREYGDKPGMAGCLEGLAGIAALYSQPIRATQLFAAAARLRETIGGQLHRRPIDGAEYERTLGLTRAKLDTVTFAAAWAQGRIVPLELAVAEALQTGNLAMDPVSAPYGKAPSIDEWDIR
jgi:predicted ATPase/transcriptional regulator with XRE-family HTH domain